MAPIQVRVVRPATLVAPAAFTRSNAWLQPEDDDRTGNRPLPTQAAVLASSDIRSSGADGA